ncbi:regucalcin-like isoform X2 [Chrysoperla carnea]|uniref:regucalcin-like isoform X2 n=1 Tax=Chrysoperla carnea TaxID=189513 RepID=UPI001D05CABB|nr:regucalcin-like isoform X2 [Chrysoperla carnea]
MSDESPTKKMKISAQKHQLEAVTEPVGLGEGLHWDADKQLLYFVDITNSRINKFDPKTLEHTSTKVEGEGKPGFVFPIQDEENRYVIGTGREIRVIEWDGKQDSNLTYTEVIAKADAEKGSRFNDAKVDNNGIIWAGLMGPEPVPNKVKHVNSKMYSFDIRTKEFVPRIENIYISNGLAWTSDNKYMYWTDTGENKIEGFDYDLKSENILSNRKTIFDFNKHKVEGKTDGITIDTDGNLYLACYGGYQVVVINPKLEKIIDTISVPAKEVTTVTFGGPNLNDLYIATSQKGADADNLKKYPKTGAVFRIKNYPAQGYPGNPVPKYEK